jgi:hypothetical protein
MEVISGISLRGLSWGLSIVRAVGSAQPCMGHRYRINTNKNGYHHYEPGMQTRNENSSLPSKYQNNMEPSPSANQRTHGGKGH